MAHCGLVGNPGRWSVCVCERGRKATVHFIMHVCFHFHKVSQNPNDCCGLVLNAWLGDPLNFSTLLPKQCLSSGQSQRSVLSVGTTLTRVQTTCFFYFFCFFFFHFKAGFAVKLHKYFVEYETFLDSS